MKQPAHRSAHSARNLRAADGAPSSSMYNCQETTTRINSKGQVTIPATLRERHGLHEGDEVDVVEDGEALCIVRAEASSTRGQRLVRHMRGRADTTMSTDQLLELLRGN